MKYFIALILGLISHYVFAQFSVTYSNSKPEIETAFPYQKARMEGNTSGSKKSGEYRYFNELSELIRKETYKKGVLIGYEIIRPKAYYYDEDSNLTEFHRYDVFGFCTNSAGSLFGNFGPTDCIDKFVYDDIGNLQEEQFYDKKNQLLNDKYMPAIIKYEYNAAGQLRRKINLSHERRPMDNIVGLCYSTYSYDEYGNRITIQHYSSNGEKSDGDFGTSTYEMKYEKRNNMIERRLLKPDGTLAGLDMNGAPKETFRYNEKDQEIYASGWTSETDLIGFYRKDYNAAGQLKSKRYYDSKDTVVFEHKTEYIYQQNVPIGEHNFDHRGEPQSERYSKLEVVIDGWKVIGELPDINKLESYGHIGFAFQIDKQGNVIGYSLTDRAGGKAYTDFCQNILNNLRFEPTEKTKNFRGTIRFDKLPHP